MNSDTANPTSSAAKVSFIVFIVLSFVIAIGWICLATFYAAYAWDTAEDSNEIMLSEFFREAGFDPSVEYPAHLGRNIDGMSGSIHGSVSLVFGTGNGAVEGNFNPTSKVTMALPLSDVSQIIIGIPYNQIRFHTDGVETPSIRFDFKDSLFATASVGLSYADGDSFWWFDRPIKDEDHSSPRDSDMWDEFSSQPLETWLLDSVEGIDLFLTQQQLEKILYGGA